MLHDILQSDTGDSFHIITISWFRKMMMYCNKCITIKLECADGSAIRVALLEDLSTPSDQSESNLQQHCVINVLLDVELE